MRLPVTFVSSYQSVRWELLFSVVYVCVRPRSFVCALALRVYARTLVFCVSALARLCVCALARFFCVCALARVCVCVCVTSKSFMTQRVVYTSLSNNVCVCDSPCYSWQATWFIHNSDTTVPREVIKDYDLSITYSCVILDVVQYHSCICWCNNNKWTNFKGKETTLSRIGSFRKLVEIQRKKSKFYPCVSRHRRKTEKWCPLQAIFFSNYVTTVKIWSETSKENQKKSKILLRSIATFP